MSQEHAMSAWVEKVQSQGRYTFTREEAEAGTGRSFVAVQSALRRLRKNGRVASPRRGFYVVVPPEYRAVGCPPASWFVDELMRDLGQPYYIGLLSAAAVYGAGHEQPMVFQVMTDRPTRGVRAGRVSVRFWMNGKVERMPMELMQTETGTMRVGTAETTAFDLVRYPGAAGHWSNVATVLSELSERLDGQALVEIAPLVRLPDVQRLGYLLDVVGAGKVAGPLARWLAGRKVRGVPLATGQGVDVDADPRWRVRPNLELEVDV